MLNFQCRQPNNDNGAHFKSCALVGTPYTISQVMTISVLF